MASEIGVGIHTVRIKNRLKKLCKNHKQPMDGLMQMLRIGAPHRTTVTTIPVSALHT
jgi:hypothetical protein